VRLHDEKSSIIYNYPLTEALHVMNVGRTEGITAREDLSRFLLENKSSRWDLQDGKRPRSGECGSGMRASSEEG